MELEYYTEFLFIFIIVLLLLLIMMIVWFVSYTNAEKEEGAETIVSRLIKNFG